MSIEKLIKKCIKGDKRSQKIFYQKYVGMLYSTSLRYLKRVEEAEEVLLQSFLKIFQKLSDFKYINEEALIGWMKKIVINESLMEIRQSHQTLYKVENIDDLKEEAEFEVDQINGDELMELVNNLPDGYRTVFCMYVVDGYSHKEIAATLGISDNTSRSQFFKARKLLREQLKMNYDESVGT